MQEMSIFITHTQENSTSLPDLDVSCILEHEMRQSELCFVNSRRYTPAAYLHAVMHA